jgi:hypothetical protein
VTTPPYPQYAGPPPPHQRRRPSGWWFVVGAGLVLAGVAIGVFLFVTTIQALNSTDAEVPADGRPHRVSVDTDGDRMVWVIDLQRPDCTIVDVETGDPVVATGNPIAEYTKTSDGEEWLGDYTIDPGSGDLEVTCQETGGPIQIGPAPQFGDFFGSIALAILIPLLLGGGGVLLLIVVGVLYATGAPRRTT